jgi:glycosyltransferase involved in cell wall biosynthesis
MCKVSTIIPIYNAETHLADAIESILNQGYQDLEVILVNDASTDHSEAIAEKYISDRVRLINNPHNRGVALSLNSALQVCSGEYIARMDADDIAMPDRIKNQVAFMDANPALVVSGSWARHIGKYEGVLERKPVGTSCVAAFMMLDNPIMHPTAMLRKRVLEKHNLKYDATFERCEDFDLWERLSHVGGIDNIPKPLLHFRVHDSSVTAKYSDEMWNKTYDVLKRGLKRIGITIDSSELKFHRKVSHGEPAENIEELKLAEKWFSRLFEANQKIKVHDGTAMREALGFVWYALCRNSSLLGMKVWSVYHRSNLARCLCVNMKQRLFLGVSVCLHSCLKQI